MHDRLDHYTDNALTDRELQQLRWKEAEFKSFQVICVNPKGTKALKFGVTYDVVGEHLDCWYLCDLGEPTDLMFAKARFCTPGEWAMWLFEREAYHEGQAKRFRLLREAEIPDARF
jgi:hypothetical protein